MHAFTYDSESDTVTSQLIHRLGDWPSVISKAQKTFDRPSRSKAVGVRNTGLSLIKNVTKWSQKTHKATVLYNVSRVAFMIYWLCHNQNEDAMSLSDKAFMATIERYVPFAAGFSTI